MTEVNYWYLRDRHGRGTAERQPSPDLNTWTWDWEYPELSFDGEADGQPDGWIDLADFCRLAGLNIHPQAEINGEYP